MLKSDFLGTFEDFAAVAKAMDGVYGAYVNTGAFFRKKALTPTH
jgi:hypothetical protein